ncbi:oxidoreductase [Alcanivorax sp. 1008]|uniref:oxidoreductase n=1 Tax=Alcanivorax sp. 1008 TaxID=2816853 RepID=UPI001DA24D9D|nr:oxidoreductase [Alcanivorax sp. 1008]MCC1495899.1 SDR family oxidoreductase [Alcanivorax sp. 1008]
MSWTPNQIPPQDGRVAVITGANSGIGFHATRELAQRGAHVVMACRNEKKARQAMEEIRADIPNASLSFVPLDLSSQKSVRDAATLIRHQQEKIDLLLNNAGLMWLEEGLTEDGFEQQIGTNHFGHFTLTLQLLERMEKVPGSRIVTVSSIAHRGGKIHFDNLTLKGEYGRQKAYAQSKLANLMFAIELDRRLQQAGALTRSLACHPGVSNTNLAVPGIVEQSPLKIGKVVDLVWPLFTQSAEKGAWPTLYAATSADAEGGHYYGPRGWFEAMGAPAPARARRYAQDAEKGQRLWQLSEQLTGEHYPHG